MLPCRNPRGTNFVCASRDHLLPALSKPAAFVAMLHRNNRFAVLTALYRTDINYILILFLNISINSVCLGKCINKKLQSPYFGLCNFYLYKTVDGAYKSLFCMKYFTFYYTIPIAFYHCYYLHFLLLFWSYTNTVHNRCL